MPSLLENTTSIHLAPTKPTGLQELGVPVGPTTRVKKGKLQEFVQLLEGGKIGRRFQNIRVTEVLTREGDVELGKVFVQFEVFGDDNTPVAQNSGLLLSLFSGSEKRAEFSVSALFLPYARFWYENTLVFDIHPSQCEAVDRLEFVAKQDQVRPV
jgi:hypothetical protein